MAAVFLIGGLICKNFLSLLIFFILRNGAEDCRGRIGVADNFRYISSGNAVNVAGIVTSGSF